MAEQDIQLTVDVVVQKGDEVLLIKRKNDPYAGRWALPGGFVENNEVIIKSAARELEEETGLLVQVNDLKFIGYFDAPERDPRGRIISLAFGCKIKGEQQIKAGDDAGEVRWFNLRDLPELAFDHLRIIGLWRHELTKDS